jgi:Protein of unknown function (DUF3040)
MELSEREKRLLHEMETQLQAEDPGLASSLVVHRLRPGARAVLATLGLLVGVLLMAVGVWRARPLGIAVALIGYLVLLASTTVAVETLRARADRPFLARARRAS